MDYSKLSTDTIERLVNNKPLDYSKLTDAELEVLSAMAPQELQEAQEPGKLESFGRGALQGASFGFSDEITGGIESAFTDKTYQQARDEAREANRLAEEANPLTYLGGNLVGAVAVPVPGGAIASGGLRAATTLGRTARLAGVGAVAGGLGAAGSSEADLTDLENNPRNLDEFQSDVTAGAAGGAVMGPLVGQALPAAAKGSVNWWKNMRFGRDLSAATRESFANPEFMTPGNLAKVADELSSTTRKELLPLVTDDLQAAASKSYEKAKEAATGKIRTKDIIQDIEQSFFPDNPIVAEDPDFMKAQQRIMSMLKSMVKNGTEVDVKDAFRLRTEIQNVMKIADPTKSPDKLDIFESANKLKDQLDNRLQDLGVPLEALGAQYKTVSEVAGQTGVDLRSVPVSKQPLRERESVEKLIKTLTQAKKKMASPEEARMTAAKKLLKESGLMDSAKVDEVFKKSEDLAGKEYLIRSALDESYLATDTNKYLTGIGALNARSKALQLASQAGATAGRTSRGISGFTNALYKATPEALIDMANRMKDTKVATRLRAIASQPEKKRKALLFTMIQSPAYRESMVSMMPGGDEE